MRQLDTSPEAAKVQQEIVRRLGPARRFQLAIDMSEFVRDLALAGLRERRPDLSEPELRRELIRMTYGIEVPLP